LKKIPKPPLVEQITIQEISVGPNVPVLSNVKLLSFTDEGGVSADAEFKYGGGFHLTIEILILISIVGNSINFPAVLSVTVQSLSGKIRFHCSPPPSKRFWIGFYEEPECELIIDTEIGDNRKIKNLPKLSNIIVHKIKSEIIETMVLPQMDDFPIPKIVKEADKKLEEDQLAAPLPTARRASFSSSVSASKLDEELTKELETIETADPWVKKSS